MTQCISPQNDARPPAVRPKSPPMMLLGCLNAYNAAPIPMKESMMMKISKKEANKKKHLKILFIRLEKNDYN